MQGRHKNETLVIFKKITFIFQIAGRKFKMFLLFIAAIIVILLYKFLLKKFHYWSERDVCQNDPWTNIKAFSANITRTKSFAEYIQQIYNDFPNNR